MTDSTNTVPPHTCDLLCFVLSKCEVCKMSYNNNTMRPYCSMHTFVQLTSKLALGCNQLHVGCVPEALCSHISWQSVKVTTQSHLVPKLRISDALPLLPQYKSSTHSKGQLHIYKPQFYVTKRSLVIMKFTTAYHPQMSAALFS